MFQDNQIKKVCSKEKDCLAEINNKEIESIALYVCYVLDNIWMSYLGTIKSSAYIFKIQKSWMYKCSDSKLQVLFILLFYICMKNVKIKTSKYCTIVYKFIQQGKSPFWRSSRMIHVQKGKSFVLAFLSSNVLVKCRCRAVPLKYILYLKPGIVKSIASL